MLPCPPGAAILKRNSITLQTMSHAGSPAAAESGRQSCVLVRLSGMDEYLGSRSSWPRSGVGRRRKRLTSAGSVSHGRAGRWPCFLLRTNRTSLMLCLPPVAPSSWTRQESGVPFDSGFPFVRVHLGTRIGSGYCSIRGGACVGGCLRCFAPSKLLSCYRQFLAADRRSCAIPCGVSMWT